VSGSGDTKSPHEAAVKAALQAGADESQREIFTQVEEVAVTTETIERFVEHNYFQREYVIAVSIVHCSDFGVEVKVKGGGGYHRDRRALRIGQLLAGVRGEHRGTAKIVGCRGGAGVVMLNSGVQQGVCIGESRQLKTT